MMKFIMVSREADGCNILHTIMCEGNEVELYITDKDDKENWNGILPKSDSLPLDKSAIYLFDSSGNGKMAEELIHKGYYVVGSNSFADRLEFDRGFGIDLMHDIGMKIPETHTFKKFSEAYDFLKDKKERFVFKPSGKGIPCHLSYVPAEGEDILPYIKYVEKAYKDIDEVELHEFIPGVAVSTEGWFNGYHFLRPFNHTLEKKKLSNGDLGPATGCAGNVVWICEEDEITKQLINLEPHLKGYIGPIDINMIVNESQYGLEFTPRMGYDSICALLPLLNIEYSKFFSDLARNQLESPIDFDESFSAALRVTIPPYPTDDVKFAKGLPIQVQDDINYFFYEVAMEDDSFVHCGSSGVVLCTLGMDSSLDKAMNEALDAADELIIPNKNYRTDLSEVLLEDFEKFEGVTYAKGRS